MPRTLPTWPFAAAFLLVVGAAHGGDDAKAAPATRPQPVKETLHGVEIIDPYRWLEDGKSKETRTWLDAQRRYTDSVLAPVPGREALKRRITELLRVDTTSAPSVHGGRYFFSKRAAGQELPVYYVRQGFEGPDEVLLDCNTLSPDKTVSAVPLDISDDGKLWVYGLRQGGEDETTVQLLDVDSRKDAGDKVAKARYFGVVLRADRSGFFYARMDKEGPRVYAHTLGKPAADDVYLFGKGYGPDKIISCSGTEDGRYLLLTVSYGSAARKTEIYVKDLKADGPVTPIVTDVDARFTGRIGGDTLFLQTNWKAPNNRIVAVSLKDPSREKWKEIVPEAKTTLQGFTLIDGKVYASYLDNAATRLKVFLPDGMALGAVDSLQLATLSVNGRWDSPEWFLTTTSFVRPPTIKRVGVRSRDGNLWSKLEVPFDSDAYVVKQVRYPSKDGTEIPMFLVHARDLKLDGSNPTFLTGYGGFNISRTPTFAATIALWVEQGGVFALPSLRGGGEFGEAWHQAGMLDKKQNVFDDFLGAAEWLVANHYTRPEKLAISGGSNGGLLVGAALTQRPDLFRAVVCSVPLLDMLRYQRFLVARFWVPEYGSAEDPEAFKWLAAYSPYHRVKEGTRYPAVLFMTGDSDTRVDPSHARKMAARLQAATASGPDRPVLLHYDTKAGHSGGKPVAQQIDDLTDEFAFLFWQLGVDPSSARR
jgi:prolyl oligopeptidase